MAFSSFLGLWAVRRHPSRITAIFPVVGRHEVAWKKGTPRLCPETTQIRCGRFYKWTPCISTGKFFPKLPPSRWLGPFRLNGRMEETNYEMVLNLEIRQSQIDVSVGVEKYSEELFTHIFRAAYDLARAAVELVAFKQGWGLTITFSRCMLPDGVSKPIAAMQPELGALCTAFSLDSDFERMLKIVLEDVLIWPVFNDLISAISGPNVAPVNCARAIEGIRHSIARGAITNRAKQWEMMRSVLNIDESYISLISDNSTDHRHGNRTMIRGAIVQEITSRAWVIADRFLEYRKRGSDPLPIDEFPLMKG